MKATVLAATLLLACLGAPDVFAQGRLARGGVAQSSAAQSGVAQDVEKGKAVYTHWCVTCHGPGLPGTVALQAKYSGSKPALLDERTDMPPAFTKTFVRKGVSVMPFFRKTEISDADLDVLAAYLARVRK